MSWFIVSITMTIEDYRFSDYRPSGYPVRHRRKVRPTIKVPLDYADRVKEIREMDSRMGGFLPGEDDYMDFFNDALASSIHYSTKIEGNPLDESEVRRLTRRSTAGEEVIERDSAHIEVSNHVSALLFMIGGAFNLPWSEEMVPRLHSLMFRGVIDGAGEYRSVKSSVQTDSGFETFIAAPPEHIEKEMKALIEWVNEGAPAYDPIVAATVFFHEFESIHPFENGNGRIGRFLLRAYLQRSLSNIHLCMIEENILRDPELYYSLLGWTDEKGDYSVLIDFVSSAILEGYRAADKYFSERDFLGKGLDETSLRIVLWARETGGAFTVGEANSWVDGVGYETVRRRLNELVNAGLLVASGNTRGRRYRFANPLREVLDRFRSSTEYADYFILNR